MASFFPANSNAFRWEVPRSEGPGLRVAQLGALHAIAGHFAVREEPALVTMPTGSGKTAVLMAAPFVLRSKRVLVITPSRLVRSQIAEEFKKLNLLLRLGALPHGVKSPKTKEIQSRITSPKKWKDLEKFDVVVGTPSSLSPSYSEIPDPPDHLFDLVLVDEAHHSPAASWEALLARFPSAKRILFTATPFRRDKNAITARFVFTYDLRAAYRDGVFGRIEFGPVKPAIGVDPDTAIARVAAAQLREDQANGFQHSILVRAGTVTRAKQLLALYEKETDLKLVLVTGQNSVRTLKGAVKTLVGREIDGIVCVDMFGEGFDFPNLKVAALHSPHKSFGVTLQFIGRFARTDPKKSLGRAIFFALESDVEFERQRLYDESSAWEEIIPALAADRIQRERESQEILETFSSADPSELSAPDVSLHAINPSFHVKVFQFEGAVDIAGPNFLGDSLEIEREWLSTDTDSRVFITRTTTRPRWTSSDGFDGVQYDLIIFVVQATRGLLFVGSTIRTPNFYQNVATTVSSSGAVSSLRPVSFERLNKVLLDIADARFFNVGMRQVGGASTTESYRTVTGSRADGSIRASDGRAYARGHLSGVGLEGGEVVSIGLSGSSKIWSATNGNVPEFLGWCDKIGAKLSDARQATTFSGVDYLRTGTEVAKLPKDVVFADWPETTYARPDIQVKCDRVDGQSAVVPLLDLAIAVRADLSTDQEIVLSVTTPLGEHLMTFSYVTARFVEAHAASDQSVTLETGYPGSLEDFLNEYLPVLRTSEFGRLIGADYLAPSYVPDPFDSATRCEVIDWVAEGVDIEREFDPAGGVSIHAYVERLLKSSAADVIFYDHGSGEIADFVTLTKVAQGVVASLYHVKASGGPKPGRRLGDAYEVCGQAIKSSHWTNRNALQEAMRRRSSRRTGRSRFVRGDMKVVEALLKPSDTTHTFTLEEVLVQPGFSKANFGPRIAAVVASADDFLRTGNIGSVRVICSP